MADGKSKIDAKSRNGAEERKVAKNAMSPREKVGRK
jgi:hypothetical protein